jgi:4-hydroxybenzoate polyprenyltransferase
MVCLQAAIGALNDIIDAPRDAGVKPGKPIPEGLVSPRTARAVAVVGGALGVGLSLPSGPATVFVAVLVLVIGGLYDLWFKGTPWSWLPFAVGIPVLPVYGWLGAAGEIPVKVVILIPVAALAGAALAIANALTDIERDRAAGVRSVATSLGPRRAWAVHAVLHVAVFGFALAGLAWLGPSRPSLPGLVGLSLGGLLLGAGLVLTAAPEPRRRERGWELEAVGIGVLGASWLAVVVLGPA